MRSDPAPQAQPEPAGEYLFVWGDTVVGRRLLIGVGIAVLGALAGLYGGQAVFTALLADAKLVHVWSLITGILGSVAAGIVTGLLFRPARTVTQDATGAARSAAVVQEMAASPQGLGTLEQASPLSRRELDEAGLTPVFEEAQRTEREHG